MVNTITWQSLSAARSDIVAQPSEYILQCVAVSAALHVALWIINAPVLISCIDCAHQRRSHEGGGDMPISLKTIAPHGGALAAGLWIRLLLYERNP